MAPWLDISLFGLTLLVMLVGLAGLVIPIFPGLLVIWLAALGYGLVAGFSPWGVAIFVLVTLLMLTGSVLDNLLMGAKARQAGASWWSIAVGLVAGVAGTVIWPPIGGLITAPAGLLLTEFVRLGDIGKAVQATKGMALGCGWSYFVRIGFGGMMVALWLVWAFFVNRP